MSKIVKYCSSCEEGFAAKFGFCPNCGNQLQAFEMNPVDAEPKTVEASDEKPANEFTAPIAAAEKPADILPVSEFAPAPPVENKISEHIPENNISAAPVVAEAKPLVEEKIIEPEIVEQPAAAAPAFEIEPQKTFAASTANDSAKTKESYQTFVNGGTDYSKPESYNYVPDTGFYVTVIEEKNVRQRNLLLLGTLATMVFVMIAGVVISLFWQALNLPSIDQGDNIAYVPEVAPAPMDEVPPPKKDKDDGGGGGGGGKNQQEDPSKGRLPPQVKDPITPPDPNITRMNNPSIPILQQTKGNNPRPITDENTGVPNGLSVNGSSGRGSGGGIGTGIGTGVGGGRGGGEGNGIGDGSGNGNGEGNGNGRGNGTGGAPPPPPITPPAGPSKGLAITSKPRANYTDAARQAQVQGTVTLRVTFNANGTIGSISPVSGLPNGLTEQAIAAARSIRFEPAMKNGVPQTVVKQVQYSFTIY